MSTQHVWCEHTGRDKYFTLTCYLVLKHQGKQQGVFALSGCERWKEGARCYVRYDDGSDILMGEVASLFKGVCLIRLCPKFGSHGGSSIAQFSEYQITSTLDNGNLVSVDTADGESVFAKVIEKKEHCFNIMRLDKERFGPHDKGSLVRHDASKSLCGAIIGVDDAQTLVWQLFDIISELKKKTWPSLEYTLELYTPDTYPKQDVTQTVQTVKEDSIGDDMRMSDYSMSSPSSDALEAVSMGTKEFNERFRRLCANGKIPVYRQRIAIVGPQGVGKTHLAKRLIQEKYEKDDDANTRGVKIYRHNCIVHKGDKSCWIRGKDDPEDQCVQNMAIGIQKSETFSYPAQLVQTSSAGSLLFTLPGGSKSLTSPVRAAAPPPGDIKSHTSPVRAAASPGDSELHDKAADKTIRDNFDPILLNKIEKMARGELVEPEKQVTIWDFAGHDVYYTTHQTFLSEQMIYLLVFRLDVDLDEKIPVYRGEKTVKEFILFWLNSIHMHTIGRLRKEDTNVTPYVLIIGTHRDKLVSKAEGEKKIGYLREYIDDKQVLKNHVFRYFPISNLDEDVEFDEIKRTIERLCGYSNDGEASDQMHPVSWIQLELNLAKKSEEKPIITIKELSEMAQRVGLPDRELQDEFIPQHHRQGEILHFKVDGLENVVIIDPHWLAGVFSVIMTPALSESGNNRLDHLKYDLKDGVLIEEVFDEYLQNIKMAEIKTNVIELMLHFDLMYEISDLVEKPLPGSGKRKFIVPSMSLSSNSAYTAFSKAKPTEYLLISFPHNFFPPGLFHRLVIRLLRKYEPEERRHGIPTVGFDQASFLLEDEQSVLHLLTKEQDMKLMITNTRSLPKPHKQVYSNARKTVEYELSTLRETYCPRMYFDYYFRKENDGKDLPFPKNFLLKDFICRRYGNANVPIDMRPYHVWFSGEDEAVKKEPRLPPRCSSPSNPRVQKEGTSIGEMVKVQSCSLDVFHQKAFHDETVYKTYTEWRGKAVIINNVSFDDDEHLHDRHGTEVDVARLKSLFQQLHYLTSGHDNLSAEGINQLAEREARSDHSAYSSFIMVILSHGGENTVIGTDGYHIGNNQIMAHFEASKCPTLNGKPKMFFISACQSSTDGNATVVKTAPKPVTAKLQKDTPPEKADMVLVLSTTIGEKSWRSPEHGTWFIQKLVTLLSERACDTHLLDILTLVNLDVSQMTTQDGCRQVSTIEKCTLRKYVYFWPGLYLKNGDIKLFP